MNRQPVLRTPLQKAGELVEPLTRRELEILALMAANRSNAEIGENLSLALSSVKWYAQQIYSKLGVENRKGAVAKARALGILDEPGDAAGDKGSRLPSGTVTFLFTDIEGSTPLWEQMPEAMRVSVAQHHALLREAIEANNGQVYQVVGDAFQAAFRLTREGLCAALAAQRALRDAQWGPTGILKVRMGLHTGPAELDGGPDAPYKVSHTLNRAARVMSTGHGGQILLSQEAADLVERELPDEVALKDLGQHHLKGMERTEHLYQAVAGDLPQDFPPLPTAVQHPHNLPVQVTSFIGRDAEIAEMGRLLGENRLVTLHGSGGTGKTRLALEVASRRLGQYPAGVWLVELAPLSDPEMVPQTVAMVLGLQRLGEISYPELLITYLRDKDLLLVLDNCEHLLEACAKLTDTLLHGCPKLILLATSREALGIAGEVGYRVPSLFAPDPAGKTAAEMARSEAVRLFVERAGAVQPGFALAEASVPAAARLCRRLDGIPLAIELAAARVKVLTVEQIAGRLDDRFRLLTGGSRTALPRQRTLRASIDWSYSLLPEPERLLLQRLSVFSGGWTLEAAEKVCAFEGLEEWEILDGLAALVNKSLVVTDSATGTEVRYRMLETIRQFTQEKLDEASQGAAVRDRHLAYFLALAEEYGPMLRTRRIVEFLDKLDLELDNLRGAITWALGKGDLEDGPGGDGAFGKAYSGVEQALRIMSALEYFWLTRALGQEISGWMERALILLPNGVSPRKVVSSVLDLRARALFLNGYLLTLLHLRLPKTRDSLAESARLFQEAGNRAGYARAISAFYVTLSLLVFWNTTSRERFGLVPVSQDDLDAARQACLDAAHELLEKQDAESRWTVAFVLNYTGGADCVLNQLDQGRELLQHARALYAGSGDRMGESLVFLAQIFAATFFPPARAIEECQRIYPELEPEIRFARRLKSTYSLSYLTAYGGLICYYIGRYQEMIDHFQSALQVNQKIGNAGLWTGTWEVKMIGIGFYYLENFPRARASFLEDLDLAIAAGDTNSVYTCLTFLAGIQIKGGALPREAADTNAVKLLGWVERQYEGIYKLMDPWDQFAYDHIVAQAKQALPAAEIDALWQQGRAMTMEQALEAARA